MIPRNQNGNEKSFDASLRVKHDPSSIKALCSRAVFLKQGRSSSNYCRAPGPFYEVVVRVCNFTPLVSCLRRVRNPLQLQEIIADHGYALNRPGKVQSQGRHYLSKKVASIFMISR